MSPFTSQTYQIRYQNAHTPQNSPLRIHPHRSPAVSLDESPTAATWSVLTPLADPHSHCDADRRRPPPTTSRRDRPVGAVSLPSLFPDRRSQRDAGHDPPHHRCRDSFSRFQPVCRERTPVSDVRLWGFASPKHTFARLSRPVSADTATATQIDAGHDSDHDPPSNGRQPFGEPGRRHRPVDPHHDSRQS